jgi:NADP-dependent 3-hydroxy acid dehydrogenase YdfG
VLITGATSGIGQSLAKQFFSIGCKLVLAGRDINKLNKIKEELCTMKMICKVSMS